MLDWTVLLAAIVAASPGIIALALAWKKSRSEQSKTDAEAAKAIVDAAGGLVAFKEKQIADMILRIKMLEESESLHEMRIATLERGIATLSKQLSDAGLTPAWSLREA
jgi:hypothetical protein